MPSTPSITEQEREDIQALRRLYEANPGYTATQLIDALTAQLGRTPSRNVNIAAESLVDPHKEAREIIRWKSGKK
ncbi:hypothetical protein O1611_g2404 [Lasiodiplodia mahajangana]|uniref:Uncharacterized protein n=1 Tax=Lasiodiplodia mahajangana TaxID=1108764 RepID=A0ACC2JV54_9PEZI|nr:hypothetical protein O1611_g2404 [Lasiodiplodia mahajangana]